MKARRTYNLIWAVAFCLFGCNDAVEALQPPEIAPPVVPESGAPHESPAPNLPEVPPNGTDEQTGDQPALTPDMPASSDDDTESPSTDDTEQTPINTNIPTSSDDDTESPSTDDTEQTPIDPVVNQTQAVSMTAPGLTNFFKVNESLFRCGQPDTGGLTAAAELGIKTVISLQLVTIDDTLDYKENTGLTLVHIPMIPWAVTQEQITEFLTTYRDAEKPVLVHCLHGSDRTGLAVAMVRILFDNWTKDQAKNEMTDPKFGYHDNFDNLLQFIDDVNIDELQSLLFKNN